MTSDLGPLIEQGHRHSHRFEFDNAHWRFEGDPAFADANGDLSEWIMLAGVLARSDAWEDRVRARAILQAVRPTLPDAFPVIYETEESPNLRRSWAGPVEIPDPAYRSRAEHVWVAHPDHDLLVALLPEYQALWDAYTEQWGGAARRTFAVAPVDGVQVHSLYRPDTTADEILLSTRQLHGMPAAGLPERLR